MRITYARTVEPTIFPITLDEAKRQARIYDTNSDDVLYGFIRTATQAAEDYLGYGLLTQTWRADCSEFEEVIHLPMARQLQSVSSVKYYDGDGTLQTLSSTYYEVDTMSRPARLVRAPGMQWPTLQADRRIGVVQITYVVGWTAATLIPETIRHGIRLFVSFLDTDRDGTDQQASSARQMAEACWADRMYRIDPCE